MKKWKQPNHPTIYKLIQQVMAKLYIKLSSQANGSKYTLNEKITSCKKKKTWYDDSFV